VSTHDPIEAQQRPYERPPFGPQCIPHFVPRGGQTLDEIADQYGISPQFLLRANPDLMIRGGQSLCIPRRRF
jgi:hypothetical protein